ncbi:MAG: phenylalanine--tRNA ligase subunit beta [Planctomycetota bacterium]
MNVSYRWLGRHVDLSGVSPEELARLLTIHAAEVEGVEPFAPVLGDVVVGHVVERSKHPGADKLAVCRVDLGPAGDGEPTQIVCGAPNVGEGQRVAVARVGTRLPGDVKIKKGKIRGEVSNGMICSVRELDLGDEHDGIWVLPGEPEVGAPVATALGVEDWVIEIDNKALTHRPDCWGHRGLAREIAAILGRELKPLDLTLPETGGGEPYPVRVDSEGCPRYLGLCIDGVKNGESPLWLRLLLLAAGQRPLDLLVDLSNFVMLDLGQPNHLFDRRRLSAAGINVRDARPGEVMETLDGIERKLTPDDMLICSDDQPVALAGVMGGEATKVDEDTSEVLAEVATFHPARVRRTAMRLGLRTDASARFEKHLDPTLPLQAAAHLVRLLRELQPDVTLPRALGDAGTWSDPARTVPLRPERVRALLGAELDDDAIEGSLGRLGLAVERSASDGEAWSVAIPAARATKDLSIEEDLIEEVGRLFGYGQVPERRLVGAIVPPPHDERRRLVRLAQDRLSGAARFHEVLTYSFLPDDTAQLFGLAELPHVEAVNPVLDGWQRIRRSVLPSVLVLLEANLRRTEVVRLFDLAKGYRPAEGDVAARHGEPHEVHELGLALAQPKPGKGARFDAGALPQLQGSVEDLLESLGRPVARWERSGELDPDATWAHPGVALAGFVDGCEEPVVLLASVEPGLARALGAGVAAADVAAARVSIDALVAAPARPSGYRPIPRFPGIKVDVAVSVGDDVPAADVAAAIEGAGKGQVASWELFDLYRGEAVGEGRKSLAYHVLLQAPGRTLSDKDEQKFLGRLEKAAQRLGGELRSE